MKYHNTELYKQINIDISEVISNAETTAVPQQEKSHVGKVPSPDVSVSRGTSSSNIPVLESIVYLLIHAMVDVQGNLRRDMYHYRTPRCLYRNETSGNISVRSQDM
ncbi:hypothetical protein J6590_078864, partial [Homalodisca vitripennis]